MSQTNWPLALITKQPKLSKYFWCTMAKSKTFPILPPSPAAGGPNGTGMNNSLEKLDAPKYLLEASKSHTSESKARAIAQYGLITRLGKLMVDNDENEKDYIEPHHNTTPHAKSEVDPFPQYDIDSDKRGTKDLIGRSQGKGKLEVVPAKIMLESAVIDSNIIAGFKESNG